MRVSVLQGMMMPPGRQQTVHVVGRGGGGFAPRMPQLSVACSIGNTFLFAGIRALLLILRICSPLSAIRVIHRPSMPGMMPPPMMPGMMPGMPGMPGMMNPQMAQMKRQQMMMRQQQQQQQQQMMAMAAARGRGAPMMPGMMPPPPMPGTFSSLIHNY